MTAEGYRVIADRSKGEDPTRVQLEPGDHLVYEHAASPFPDLLMRVERPGPPSEWVPTAKQVRDSLAYDYPEWRGAFDRFLAAHDAEVRAEAQR